MQRTHLKNEKSAEQTSAFVVNAAPKARRLTLEKSPWARTAWRSEPAAVAKSGWGVSRKN